MTYLSLTQFEIRHRQLEAEREHEHVEAADRCVVERPERPSRPRRLVRAVRGAAAA
jgi:hypothetical protein